MIAFGTLIILILKFRTKK
ncbi:MAG: hypothetical protein LBB91_01160 [Clostridiales bacterium]|nr:hypothetical protein [Clostridiales bacterium]